MNPLAALRAAHHEGARELAEAALYRLTQSGLDPEVVDRVAGVLDELLGEMTGGPVGVPVTGPPMALRQRIVDALVDWSRSNHPTSPLHGGAAYLVNPGQGCGLTAGQIADVLTPALLPPDAPGQEG